MEQEKTSKTAKKQNSTKTAPKATTKTTRTKKIVKEEVSPEIETKVEKVEVEQTKAETPTAKTYKSSFSQDLNLVIGFISLLTILAFCFTFEDAEVVTSGWELILKSGAYSGVFKGLMILSVIAIFIDCILAIKIDTECEIFNIVEKALYVFTLVINFITVAILITLISKIGIGLIMFLIISIVSAIIKLVRIFDKR